MRGRKHIMSATFKLKKKFLEFQLFNTNIIQNYYKRYIAHIDRKIQELLNLPKFKFSMRSLVKFG